MHKPIFILINAENAAEAKQEAHQFINDNLIDNGFDWHQGLIESKRWSKELEIYDTPQDASTKESMLFIIEMIKLSQAQILEWIERGNQQLKTKDGLYNLGSILSNFSIASGKTSGNIFDTTDWSYSSPIVDFDSLHGFWDTNENSKIFICGFDIHY